MEGDVRKAFAGVSAYHLNQPSENFFQKSEAIPVSLILHAGTVLYQSRSYLFTPTLYYTRLNQVSTYRALLSNRIPFTNTNSYDLIASGSLDIQLNYSFRRDGSLGITFNQPGFSIGFAYQFPFGETDAYLKNGFQLGISISRLLWKKAPQRVVIAESPSRRQINFETQAIGRQASEVEAIESKIDELDKVRALQFELSKDFKFEFGKTNLSPESLPFLNDLSALLITNPAYRVQIIGHTDNVGKQQVNYEVSLTRAQGVADYLLQKGVAATSIEVIGMGDTRPTSPNDTPENNAKNRRVEFIIFVNR